MMITQVLAMSSRPYSIKEFYYMDDIVIMFEGFTDLEKHLKKKNVQEHLNK